MKILFVEDELSQNIERILQLFGSTVLSEKQRTDLRELNNDPYGAVNHDILDIIQSGVLNVETDFIPALQRIERDCEKYDLFIVDRQLAKDADAYQVKDVAAIVPEYTEQDFADYLTREGDYLFERLLRKPIQEKCRMFYFLTAYTDMIKCQECLRPYRKAGWFTDEQVLEKGNIDHMRRLCDVIKQSPFLSVRYKYLPYFEKVEALDDSPDTLHRLVKLFEAHERCTKNNRSSVLSDVRGLLEAIVKTLCAKHNLMHSGHCKEDLHALGANGANDTSPCLRPKDMDTAFSSR